MKIIEQALGGVVITISVIVGIAGISLLLAFPIMWCWNHVMPLFGLVSITWGQAWCLNFVCNCLIRGTTTVNK